MVSEKQMQAAAKAMETLALERGFVPWDEAASVALTAAEQAEPVRVKVKPLVWRHHPAGLVASAGGIGEAYIIDTRIARRVCFLKGMDPNREYPSVEAAKAAAQADYERRILAALEHAEPAPAAEAVARVERGSEQSTPKPESRLREARLREALESIANNMCCSGCQEAALVARAALKEEGSYRDKGRE